MTNEDFISQHLHDDVRSLALKMPRDIDATWCLQQIEGYQIAERKIPRWTQIHGMWYPVKLSLEQCSSGETAGFKARLLTEYLNKYCKDSEKSTFADLTGGLGVDFSYMAPLFSNAVYVERNSELCQLARHNFPLLGLSYAEVREESSPRLEDFGRDSIVFIDPARRDNVGRKVAGLRDCSPDVTGIVPQLLQQGASVMLKLSPMLDIKEALRELPGEWHIYVISVNGECKELLMVSAKEQEVHAVNIIDGEPFDYCPEICHTQSKIAASIENGRLLFEPNASILKAGVQDSLCLTYDMEKLHPQSNLFILCQGHTSEGICKALGRLFVIESACGFSKGELKSMLADISKANITVRNFPISVAELRKKLKLKEGGDCYLFATTLADGKHILIRCRQSGS